ncbi:MAG: UvrD-helicase domain-containing protein [Bryobacteraceae bacterium]|nr:UvrD-helicase domain-containing protein [Bryobacteraceae bacterium]
MDFLSGLNPQQRQAVEHVEGPLLLLAGAGSGKTRVITHRIAHLVTAHRVPGPAVLAVTFTNKAAGEMRDRVEKLLGGASYGLPEVSTFHSFCVRLLRREGAPLAAIRPGFTTRFNIYDDDDQIALLKQAYRALGLDEKFMPYRTALSRISHAKSNHTAPEDMARNAQDPLTQRLASVYERYEGGLRQANALDFDDLLLEAVRLLRHSAEVRDRLNWRIEFLMVDEYQDTNRSQYELMRLVSQERKNICVVGDEDQSIYGWRGADIRNILDFEKDFPDARVIRLEQNYRSTKNILEAASAVVANNKERKGKWLWTDSGEGDRIGLYEALDGENEALWIADTIERHMDRNPDERIAVLYRTNFQSRQIEEALRRHRRRYIVVGGFSFYQRAEVKDILCYLRALASPHDSIALLRILNVPARGIGKTTIEQIEAQAAQNQLSLWDAIARMLEEGALPGRAEAAVGAFRRMMEELAGESGAKPLNDFVRGVMERSGYEKMLAADESPDAESRMENLNELVNAAAEAAERGETLADFLDHAALVADADQVDERAPVSLLTVHNAKGLEFPVVFLAGLEEGLFPHSRSLNSESMLEEERRLCYVGMTRAQKKLYLSCARYRRRFGGGPAEPSLRSRFLREVPATLVEKLSPSRGIESTPQVDLYAEQHEVREAVKKNLYTGKTYNSVDNIKQFFAERGMPAPRGLEQPQAPRPPQAAQPSAPVYPPRKETPPPVARQTRPAAAKRLAAGATITHPKYGRGTILRREGDGDDAKLTVSFPGYGLKKIVERFLGQKIEE